VGFGESGVADEGVDAVEGDLARRGLVAVDFRRTVQVMSEVVP
jgi:hypothetical protein